MLTIIVCHPDGRVEEGVAIDQIPSLLQTKGSTVWLDLAGPTREEQDVLTSVFHFHHLALEDSDSRRHNPKVDDYGSYLFILTHGVHPESSAREFRTRQLTLFLGPNYLVSLHREASRSVELTRDSVRKNPRLMADGPGMLLYRVLDFQMDLYMPLMENFQKRLDEIEKSCFEATTSVILRDVFDLRKALVRLRRFSGHQREILLRLSRREFPLVDERSAIYLRDVYDHLLRVTDLADTYRELIAGSLEAHLSIVSNRTNEIMRALTVITTLFMPLTLIAGIYGMNFPDMPEYHWRWGHLFAYGLMVAVALVMFYLFRLRGVFRGPGR